MTARGTRSTGQDGSDGQNFVREERIYQLGETYTHWSVSGNLKLFSVRVNRRAHDTHPLGITITNYNIPDLPVNSFMVGRRLLFDGNFNSLDLDLGAISLGNYFTHWTGGGVTLWLGTPTPGTNNFTPFVRFNIS